MQTPDCPPQEIMAKLCDPNVPPPVKPRDPNPGLTRAVFNGLSLLADSLAIVRGLKALVLFSSGGAQPPSDEVIAGVVRA